MHIDYQKLINESMLHVVRAVLIQVQNEGLSGDNHFYIAFRTYDPLVILPARVKSRYPEEITIVLQHQFKQLVVHKDHFTVVMSFDGRSEHISVPFRAITSFVDPSTNFGVQFEYKPEVRESDFLGMPKIHGKPTIKPLFSNKKSEDSNDYPTHGVSDNLASETESAKVVPLDAFRNKNKPQ